MLYPFRLFLTLKTLVSRMSDASNVISVSNVNNCSNAISANIVSNGSKTTLYEVVAIRFQRY
jgi:hypothetical protein